MSARSSILCALLVAACLLAAPAAALSSGPPPRLGRSNGPAQRGYGHVRPSTIFNGGDPTGFVGHVHWTGWGSATATGTGEAEYVWPGTCVACNGYTTGARVVAFHLGTCHGYRSYNAIEWFFPKFGQRFDAHRYIDTCTGAYVGALPRSTSCPNAPLPAGAGSATEVTAIDMSCQEATRLISESPAAQYASAGGRFEQAGFRCGSEGGGVTGSALFACEAGEREFLYDVAP
jgi:hypothetical protein